MILGSCVFVLVTAFASLLHRAFTITNEVPNSQPIPNTFLHGMCLCSTACNRAFIYSVPVRYTNKFSVWGLRRDTSMRSWELLPLGLHMDWGITSSCIVLDLIFMVLFCWKRAHLSSEVGVLKCRWRLRCAAKSSVASVRSSISDPGLIIFWVGLHC